MACLTHHMILFSLFNLIHVSAIKFYWKQKMLLILKAQMMPIPLGAKLLKVSNDSTIHRAKTDYPSFPPPLPNVCQEFTGVYQKSRWKWNCVLFHHGFCLVFLPSPPVHLLEWWHTLCSFCHMSCFLWLCLDREKPTFVILKSALL